MATAEQLFLTFDVGGEPPKLATVKINGALDVEADIRKGSVVGVHLVDADGRIITTGTGTVVAVAFRRRTSAGNELTERVHTIKLES